MEKHLLPLNLMPLPSQKISMPKREFTGLMPLDSRQLSERKTHLIVAVIGVQLVMAFIMMSLMSMAL
ncbi:MAG: hypothetical protein ACPGWR_14015 [Ardenticatenaceae bacterium]